MKKSLIALAAAAALLVLVGNPRAVASLDLAGSARLSLVEATVGDLHKAIQTGLVTIEELTAMYLARIAAYDDAGPGVNAFLHVNPDAATVASDLDLLRHPGVARGALYGIPVLLKETEFANFIALGMPTGYSSLGGFGFNPYDPRPLPGGDGRPVLQTGGSSSGSAIGVNANLTALAVGAETSGSILSPASANAPPAAAGEHAAARGRSRRAEVSAGTSAAGVRQHSSARLSPGLDHESLSQGTASQIEDADECGFCIACEGVTFD